MYTLQHWYFITFFTLAGFQGDAGFQGGDNNNGDDEFLMLEDGADDPPGVTL